MAIYNEKIGEMTRDNLFADIYVKQIVSSGVIAAGQGKLARGTILALDVASNKLAIMGTEGENLIPYGVLCDAVDATAEDAVCELYMTGKFNKSALIVKEGYTLTAEDISMLRNAGIFMENTVK